jgi:hypothetical protein
MQHECSTIGLPVALALLRQPATTTRRGVSAVAASEKPQVVQPADKARAIETVVQHIEKQFGKGAIMRLGEASKRMAVETIPTGAIGLDIALGVGGVPRGRVVEIFGPEASGKTTLVQHIIAEAQRPGGVCAIIDAEHALDPEYARKLGVDVDNCSSRSPTPASRRSRSPRPSCARRPSTWSPSTPWPHWDRAPSARARWVTATWAYQRGSCRKR